MSNIEYINYLIFYANIDLNYMNQFMRKEIELQEIFINNLESELYIEKIIELCRTGK